MAMATTAETAKSLLSSVVGIEPSDILQHGGPLGAEGTEDSIQRERLPLSELCYLFCVSEIERIRSTSANYGLPPSPPSSPRQHGIPSEGECRLDEVHLLSHREKSGCPKR